MTTTTTRKGSDMPYGGDPVKELGPGLLKGCAALIVIGLALAFVLGTLL